MVDDNVVPKGMRRVLEERDINTARLNADDMRVVLATHSDFQEEKTVVETYLLNLGYQVLFTPKLHCELNPRERVWGQAKVYTRKFTNFSLIHLRKNLNPTVDSVSTDTIRKYFRKIQGYERAYIYIERKQAGRRSHKRYTLQITKEVFMTLID